MVMALLENRKKITRRTKGLENISPEATEIVQIKSKTEELVYWAARFKIPMQNFYKVTNTIKCPYGQVGDILWVRETFAKNGDNTFSFKTDFPFSNPHGGWKPSIHMPKEACRLKLKITNIRVERLQDITEEDAIAEGIEKVGFMYLDYYKNSALSKLATKKDAIPLLKYPINSFRSLWVSINGIHAWEDNPWVWVIKFKRVQS